MSMSLWLDPVAVIAGQEHPVRAIRRCFSLSARQGCKGSRLLAFEVLFHSFSPDSFRNGDTGYHRMTYLDISVHLRAKRLQISTHTIFNLFLEGFHGYSAFCGFPSSYCHKFFSATNQSFSQMLGRFKSLKIIPTGWFFHVTIDVGFAHVHIVDVNIGGCYAS